MPNLVGTTWRTHALTIHVLAVDETRLGGELTITTEPQSGNCTSLEQFWEWVEAKHAECDAPVSDCVAEPCLI